MNWKYYIMVGMSFAGMAATTEVSVLNTLLDYENLQKLQNKTLTLQDLYNDF